MAQTLYAPLNGVSDEVKKILVSTGGLSDYVVKGYCSVGGLSKLFFRFTPTPPVPIYNIVPEYTYVVNNTYQVHNLLTPQITLDALYQYFDRIYSSSLSSVTYLKEHWSEIRNDILSYISSFNTIYLSFLVNKRNNQVNITANVGQNTYPKATVIASQASPRYGTIWRINNNTSENIQTTHYYNITVTSNSYTADTPTSWTSDMYEIGLYGAISDNVNVTDAIVLSNYGMTILEPWSYKSAIQELLITFEQLNPSPYTPDYTFTKKYEGMSYYGIIKYKNSGDTEYYTAPILFSRTSNGTKVNEYNYQSKYFQVGTDGWYYGIPLSFTDAFMQQLRINPECWLTDEKMDNQYQLENFLANFILTRIEPYEN